MEQGHPDLPGAGHSHAAAALHQHGARRLRGAAARARRRLSGHGLGDAGGASRDRASHRQRRRRPLRGSRAAAGDDPRGEPGLIQEGLRGVVRLPGGTASALDSGDFPIPVMGKTGTTSEFRDALFVGSTYGPRGITVAVRIGFDDNRTLGREETGGRTALPIFREIMVARLQGRARRTGAAVPRRDRGTDRRVPGEASRGGGGRGVVTARSALAGPTTPGWPPRWPARPASSAWKRAPGSRPSNASSRSCGLA